MIIIEHVLANETVATVMGHLRSTGLNVTVGQWVTKGYLLGYLGSSSENGGYDPHIHYGVNKGSYSGANALGCDNGWVYEGYARDSCVQGDWYDPTDFNQAHAQPCPGGGPWSGWEDLGGPSITSAPAVAWDCNRLDVFALGTNNYVWHKWYDGVWHPWENMNFVGSSAPAAASWAPGRLDVFVRGTNGALWHQWFDGGWHTWESLGGALASNSPQLEGPGAAAWDVGRLDVFARGTNNAIWHTWYNGAWQGWESLGGSFSYGAAASSWGPGRLDVFARDSGAVQHKAYAGGWSSWENLGGASGGTRLRHHGELIVSTSLSGIKMP